MKIQIVPHAPVKGAASINCHLKSEASIMFCQLFSTCLHRDMNQDLVEKSWYPKKKIRTISIAHAKEAIMCNHQLLAVSKDNWNIKEDAN